MNQIIDLFSAIRIKIREKLNPYLGKLRIKRLDDPNFTIISNNCWGGHVYRFFSSEYLSPTVGLYFYAKDYIKFVANLEYYMSLDLKMIDIEQSKHKDDLREKGNQNDPIGVLDDVEIVFHHYNTPEEAYTKWNRRKERINWDHLVYKMSEMNQCTKEDLVAFDKLPIGPKVCFVSQDYGLNSQIIMKGNPPGNVINDTTPFRTYIDLYRFINGEDDFKKRQ